MIKVTLWVEPEHNEVREVEYDYNQAPTQIPEKKNIVRWMRATAVTRKMAKELAAENHYISPEYDGGRK